MNLNIPQAEDWEKLSRSIVRTIKIVQDHRLFCRNLVESRTNLLWKERRKFVKKLCPLQGSNLRPQDYMVNTTRIAMRPAL